MRQCLINAGIGQHPFTLTATPTYYYTPGVTAPARALTHPPTPFSSSLQVHGKYKTCFTRHCRPVHFRANSNTRLLLHSTRAAARPLVPFLSTRSTCPTGSPRTSCTTSCTPSPPPSADARARSENEERERAPRRGRRGRETNVPGAASTHVVVLRRALPRLPRRAQLERPIFPQLGPHLTSRVAAAPQLHRPPAALDADVPVPPRPYPPVVEVEVLPPVAAVAPLDLQTASLRTAVDLALQAPEPLRGSLLPLVSFPPVLKQNR